MNQCNHCGVQLEAQDDYCLACGNFVEHNKADNQINAQKYKIKNTSIRASPFNRNAKKSNLSSTLIICLFIGVLLLGVFFNYSEEKRNSELKNYFLVEIQEFTELLSEGQKSLDRLNSGTVNILSEIEFVLIPNAEEMLRVLNKVDIDDKKLREAHEYLILFATLRLESFEIALEGSKTEDQASLELFRSKLQQSYDYLAEFNVLTRELFPDIEYEQDL